MGYILNTAFPRCCPEMSIVSPKARRISADAASSLIKSTRVLTFGYRVMPCTARISTCSFFKSAENFSMSFFSIRRPSPKRSILATLSVSASLEGRGATTAVSSFAALGGAAQLRRNRRTNMRSTTIRCCTEFLSNRDRSELIVGQNTALSPKNHGDYMDCGMGIVCCSHPAVLWRGGFRTAVCRSQITDCGLPTPGFYLLVADC